MVITTGVREMVDMLMTLLWRGGQRSWTRDTLCQAWVKRFAPVRMVVRIDGPSSFRAGCLVLGTSPLEPAGSAGAGSVAGTEGDPGRGSPSLMRSPVSGAQLIASSVADAPRGPASPSSFFHPLGLGEIESLLSEGVSRIPASREKVYLAGATGEETRCPKIRTPLAHLGARGTRGARRATADRRSLFRSVFEAQEHDEAQDRSRDGATSGTKRKLRGGGRPASSSPGGGRGGGGGGRGPAALEELKGRDGDRQRRISCPRNPRLWRPGVRRGSRHSGLPEALCVRAGGSPSVCIRGCACARVCV